MDRLIAILLLAAVPAWGLTSISVYKTFTTEVLTSSDLNNSFTRILDATNNLIALHPGDSTKTKVGSFDTLTTKSLARIILDKEVESITSDDSLDLHRAYVRHIKADTIGSDSLTVSGNLVVGSALTAKTSTGNVAVGGATTFGTGATNTLAIKVGATPPTAGATDAIMLWAEGGSAELKVMDESGDINTLSPHVFDLFTPAPPDSQPWSFHNERVQDGQVIEVDMLRLASEVERLTGRKLIFYGKRGKDGVTLLSP